MELSNGKALKLTRFSLLALLLPLLVICYFLIKTPLCYTHGYMTMGWLNEDRTIAYFLTQSNIGPPTGGSTRQWGQQWAIDLSTGKLSRLPDDQHIGSRRNPYYPRIQSRAVTRLDSMDAYWNSQIKEWQVLELDLQTQKFVPGRRFEFPVQGQLVADRFMVGMDDKQIMCLDLDDPNATIRSLSAPNANRRSEILQILNSRSFYRFNTVNPSGVAINPKTPSSSCIELFKIDPIGTPTLVSSWQVENASRKSPPFAVIGEQLVSIASNPFRIEFHDVSDGKLASSELLPSEFDPSNIKQSGIDIRFNHLFFSHAGGTSVYDLKHRAWILLPGRKYFVMDYPVDDDTLLLLPQDESKIPDFEVFDCAAKQRIGTIARRDGIFYELIDRDTFAEVTLNEGFSVRIVDLQTKEAVKWFRPLWWVVPATAILVIGYALWAIAWMVVSTREGGSAWMDAALVGGLFVGALTLRMVDVGGAPCFMRLPNWFGFGIFCAALMLAEFYLVFGKARLAYRITPLSVLLATLLAILSLIFKTDPRWAWFGLATMISPVGFMLVVFILIRLLGWRPKRDQSLVLNSREGQPTITATYPAATRLVDIFLLMTCIGAVVAAVRPILSAWGHAWSALMLYYESFAIVGLCLLVGILALSRWRVAFFAGCLLTASAYIYMLIPPLMDFTAHGSGIALQMATGAANRGVSIEATLSAMTAFFALIIPFRLRGWRIA